MVPLSLAGKIVGSLCAIAGKIFPDKNVLKYLLFLNYYKVVVIKLLKKNFFNEKMMKF